MLSQLKAKIFQFRLRTLLLFVGLGACLATTARYVGTSRSTTSLRTAIAEINTTASFTYAGKPDLTDSRILNFRDPQITQDEIINAIERHLTDRHVPMEIEKTLKTILRNRQLPSDASVTTDPLMNQATWTADPNNSWASWTDQNVNLDISTTPGSIYRINIRNAVPINE